MTCIVGFSNGKKVFIGGDSAGVAGYSLRIREDEKVFKNGEMIFGFTSSFRMGQLLRYKLNIPNQENGVSDYEYMCTKFIDSVIECLDKNKYAKTDSNVVSGGTFLVGYRGSLYQVSNDFQVGKVLNNFDSCGCGEEYALGALEALSSIEMKPKTRIKMALKAAAEFSAGVAAPFKIISI